MKKLLFVSLISLLAFGCKHKSECTFNQMEPVLAYFCIPEQMESSLPLVISHTANGWRAHYGGSTTDSSIELRVRECEDEEVLAFDEYINGKLNGSYYIESNYLGGGMLYYHRIAFNDTISFYITTLEDLSELNHEEFVSDAGLYYTQSQLKCQRALIQAYSNPQRTLDNGLDFDDEEGLFESVVSPDGKMRINSAFFRTAGNGHGNLWQYIILQYNDGKGVTTLCNFIDPYSDDILTNDISMNYGHFGDFRIHLVKIKGNDYYLIESTPWDEVPMSIAKSKQDYYANHWAAISAYQIRNGKLYPVPILNGKNSIIIIAHEVTTDMHFIVDSQNGIIKVPHVSTNNHVFSGIYDSISL